MAVLHRGRRLAFITRSQVAALVAGGRIELDLAPDLRVGRRVRLRVQRGTRNHVVVAPGVVVQDDVLIMLRGGTLRVGTQSRIRRGAILKVDGELTAEEHTIIGYGNVVHCSASILIGAWTGCGEYVTITDSTHDHDGEHAAFHTNVTSDPVVIGRNVWIGSKSTVLAGVAVGHNSVVAAHALVTADVPEATTVGGVPARTLAVRTVSGQARRLVDPEASAGDVERT